MSNIINMTTWIINDSRGMDDKSYNAAYNVTYKFSKDSRDRFRMRVDVQSFVELRYVQFAPSHTWLKNKEKRH